MSYLVKQKKYLNKKIMKDKQSQLIRSLEGIGDILIHETKRKERNKSVIKGLKRIENIIIKLFDIKQNDPERFEKLLLADEFFELYEKDEDEAKLRLALEPEKHLIAFSSAINQILRIHEASLKERNNEISRIATYSLSRVLAHLTKLPDNVFFVEQILRALLGVSRRAIEEQDISMFPATIHWYVDIVFDKIYPRENGFDLSYLKLLDRYFFSAVQFVILKDQEKLFKSLASSLVDGLHIHVYDKGAIWDYVHLLLVSDLKKYNKLDDEYSIENRLRKLSEEQENLKNLEELNSWKIKFRKLKGIIDSDLTREQKNDAKNIEKRVIKYLTSKYKLNNLLEIVFNICAYCLFKEKISFMVHLPIS
jgi:hypothetical protein